MHVGRRVGCAALLAALVGLPACAVPGYPPAVGGYATVYADTVPEDIYAYPHVYYDGADTYLVGNQWYYPTGGGWLVLRSEPPYLNRYRSYFYGGAPGYSGAYGAPGYYGGPYPYGRPYRYGRPYPYGRYNVAPPAYGYPPPAQRVR